MSHVCFLWTRLWITKNLAEHAGISTITVYTLRSMRNTAQFYEFRYNMAKYSVFSRYWASLVVDFEGSFGYHFLR